MTRRLAILAVPAAAAALVAGCGSSDDPASESASANRQSAAAAEPAATAAANGRVTVTTTEFAFAPTAITAKAGKLKITLDNKGKIQHELVVLKSGADPASLKVGASGRVSESASVGEVSETDAATTKSATLDLKPGTYVYVCNIPGHYADGMYGSLTVK
jgi:uncharacterized cupredoxin-like copper-binding protein